MAEGPPDLQRRLAHLELTCRYLLFALRGRPELPAVEDMQRIVDASELQEPAARRRRVEQTPDRVDIQGQSAITDHGGRVTAQSAGFRRPSQYADAMTSDLAFNYSLTLNPRASPQYRLLQVFLNGPRLDAGGGGFAEFLRAQQRDHPSQRLLIVLYVAPGYSNPAFPRPGFISDVTNIPVLFCRLNQSLQQLVGGEVLSADNSGNTLWGTSPTNFHELYEALQIRSGALA